MPASRVVEQRLPSAFRAGRHGMPAPEITGSTCLSFGMEGFDDGGTEEERRLCVSQL